MQKPVGQYSLSLMAGVCLLLGLWSLPVFADVSVQGVRVWRAPERTRVVLDLNRATDHTILMLENPRRLVIDLPNASLKTSLDSVDFKNSPISKLRAGVRNGSGLRLVLELKSAIKPRSFSLPANEQYGNRLVVDLMDEAQAKPRVVTKRAQNVQKRDIVIAIDAGHGGEDPGAIGARRVREKVVVLQIAKKLAKLINAEKGFRAVLVRKGDYFLSLRERPKIAQKARADLFLSIHADAFRIKSAKGGSIYTLSKKGNLDTFARALQDRENKADLIGGITITEHSDDDVYGVLVDLAMTASKEASERVGKKILAHMKPVMPLHKRSLQGANFAVLRSPDVPSLLIETGFVSNPEEARKLSTGRYQSQLAHSIFNGIKQHFTALPPEGSLLAWQKSKTQRPKTKAALTHIIRSGETLSGIAQLYRVSMHALKKHNGLNSNVIKIGQRLKIPG